MKQTHCCKFLVRAERSLLMRNPFPKKYMAHRKETIIEDSFAHTAIFSRVSIENLSHTSSTPTSFCKESTRGRTKQDFKKPHLQTFLPAWRLVKGPTIADVPSHRGSSMLCGENFAQHSNIGSIRPYSPANRQRYYSCRYLF